MRRWMYFLSFNFINFFRQLYFRLRSNGMAWLYAAKVYAMLEEIEFPEHYRSLLADGENVMLCAKSMRDVAIFTDRRIIIADRKGLSKYKTAYVSVPFGSIATYSAITPGELDSDSELKIVLFGGIRFEIKFYRKSDPQLLKKADTIIRNALFGKSS